MQDCAYCRHLLRKMTIKEGSLNHVEQDAPIATYQNGECSILPPLPT